MRMSGNIITRGTTGRRKRSSSSWSKMSLLATASQTMSSRGQLRDKRSFLDRCHGRRTTSQGQGRYQGSKIGRQVGVLGHLLVLPPGKVILNSKQRYSHVRAPGNYKRSGRQPRPRQDQPQKLKRDQVPRRPPDLPPRQKRLQMGPRENGRESGSGTRVGNGPREMMVTSTNTITRRPQMLPVT